MLQVFLGGGGGGEGLVDFVLATKKMSDCYTMGRNV